MILYAKGMRKFLAKFAIFAVTLVLTIDLTIINTALDKIQMEFGASLSQIQWVINAFALATAAFLVPMGRLADIWSRKKALFLGVGIFIVASLIASVSPSIDYIIVARFLLGIGIAILHPVTQVLMVEQFPIQRKRQAISLWIMALGIGLVLGPFVGGFFVTYFSWRYVFTAPAILLFLGAFLLKFYVGPGGEKAIKKTHPLDFVLLLLALFFLVLPITEGKTLGFSSLPVLLSFLLSIVLFTVLFFFERKLKDPMIPLALFRKKTFVACSCINFSISFFAWTILFVVPFYLQKQLQFTAFSSGLFLLFFACAVVLSSQIQSIIKKELSAKVMFVFGIILCMISSLLQYVVVFHLVALAISLALFGLAPPMLQSNSTSMVLSLVKANEFASATAFLRMIQTIGGMMGVAVSGAIIQAYTLVDGYPLVFETLFCVEIFLLLFILYMIRGNKKVEGR